MNIENLEKANQLLREISYQEKLINASKDLFSRFKKSDNKIYLSRIGDVALDSDIVESVFAAQMQREEEKMSMLKKQFDEL